MAVEEELNIRGGQAEGTRVERELNRRVGNFTHVFLSFLAILVLIAAGIALVETVYREFPTLWQPGHIYQSFHEVLLDILLLAIAAELALLLLFHRLSAAVEVVMFVIARRMVASEVSPLDLLIGSLALSALLIVRFYYLPGRPD
jgi:uncharacterized membrane protein (DUF373 family)